MKQYTTIGCCGIDCGLCPRFNSTSKSACSGCNGLKFKEKHPSCGFITCCVIKNNSEVCSQCSEYPCKKFDAERNGRDSFVSHKMIFSNLNAIKLNGIEDFIEKQKCRMDILNHFLGKFDDGRSKSLFCLTCTLFPLENLTHVLSFASTLDKSLKLKEKNLAIRNKINEIALELNILLKLNNSETKKS